MHEITAHLFMFLFCLAIVIYDPIHGKPIQEAQPTAPQERDIDFVSGNTMLVFHMTRGKTL